MTAPAVVEMVMPVAALAAEINTEHERAYGKAREALEHARRAGGVATVEEQRILQNIQRRLLQSAIVNLEAAAAAGVSHLSQNELRHSLECCEDCMRMAEALLPDDLVIAVYRRKFCNIVKPLIADIRLRMGAA